MLRRVQGGLVHGQAHHPVAWILPPGGAPSGERVAKVWPSDQGFDVAPADATGGSISRDPQVERRLEAGLRAAGALASVGLDPEAFEIDRKLRPMPFPAWPRSATTMPMPRCSMAAAAKSLNALEALRQVRAERERRPFMILGASGAGKSSLLKAGIIPRLRREAPAWLPLRAFRPGADPLLNFAEASRATLADFGKVEAHGEHSRPSVRCLVQGRAQRQRTDASRPSRRWKRRSKPRGGSCAAAADRQRASILISIDQAEEIRAGGRRQRRGAGRLSSRPRWRRGDGNWQLAFTIRTDSFPELQSHRRFQDLKARGYDLRAIPVFRFDSVVEEPAKRYGVEVDHALVDALMEDAPKEDALPLLAFALQRLWRQYAASGALTKDNYDKVGGLRGLIEDAAERALRGLTPEEDVALPSGPPPKRRVDLAASTFVPALAQINDQGATIRRIAAWNSFSDEQQELLIGSISGVSLSARAEADGGTVEVAHEALFREWTRLKGWLEPERARLEALRSLQVDALTWDRNGESGAIPQSPGQAARRGGALAGSTPTASA